MDHLERNKLIAKEQHGFVKNKSCLTNLLETMDTVTDALNNGHQTLVVFLDFQKAFDKVCHESLHYKLEQMGFCEKIRKWLRCYLSGRRQRVMIGDSYSEWRPVTSGVPQGSVLGPLLFVIFINDMPEVVNHLIKLFADDSKIIGVIKNNRDLELMQKDLDALVIWKNEWRMVFHPDKCKVMDICKKRKDRPKLTMEKPNSTGRHTLEYTEVERDLGIMISQSLNMEHQVMNAVTKASTALSILRKTFKFWTPSTFRNLYTAFVRPHLEYAAPAWSPYRKKDILALERVQKRATKLVRQLKNLSYEERLAKLNLTTLEKRRNRGDLIQLFKMYSNINIINWHKGPTIEGNSRPRRYSNQHRLRRPPPATCPQRENFFTYRVIKSWNSLPQEVIQAKSVNQFKTLLDKYHRKEKPTEDEALRLGKIRV